MRSTIHEFAVAALTVSTLVLLVQPALAAEVVAVRIGTHDAYTRVVFELDAPAGYRVQRTFADDGAAQLLVTMDAGSGPRSLDSDSVMVERVAVQDGTDSSTAHVRLKHMPAQLKERILAGPPRLVFDFFYPSSVLEARKATARRRAVARPTPAETVPAPVEPRVEPEPAPLAPVVAVPTPTPPEVVDEPVPAPAPIVPVAPVVELAAVEPGDAPEAESGEAEPGPAEDETAAPAPEAAEKPNTDAAPESDPAAPQAPTPIDEDQPTELAEAEAGDDGEDVTAAIREAVLGKPETAPPAELERTRVAVPAAPASPASAEAPPWTLLAGVGAGLLALVAGLVFWRRHTAASDDADVMKLDGDAGDDDDMLSHAEATGDADAGLGEVAGDAGSASAGLLEDDSDKESEAMDLETPDLPMERTASEMPTQMGTPVDAPSPGGGDAMAMMREFESRLVKLETQLDEANDARERLERQVTAQAEELRVQRAAIARTQRALRGMSRGEAEQATEPALRDPNA